MNLNRYQKSITRELDTVKNRVRDLIDKDHWLSDGVWKEAILKNVIKRNLPSNLSMGTGFVINSITKKKTTQIDIIIYENDYSPLFIEGDFVLIDSSSVRGIVEVKTSLDNTNLKKAFEKINQNVKVITSMDESNLKFTGLFSYAYKDYQRKRNRIENEKQIDAAKERLKGLKLFLKNNKEAGLVNHISLGKDFFIRYWKENLNEEMKAMEFKNGYYNFYHLEDLSYSYFISNLYELCSKVDLTKRQWFSFPIEGGKEIKKFASTHGAD